MSLNISQIINNLIDVNDIKYDRKYSRVAKLHKYWSRKPWFVIDQYIEKYSEKNHLILDPFCGSGIIGLQSVLAGRNFIGYDLNPFAVFLAKNSLKISYNQTSFENELSAIEDAVSEKIMALYKTKNKYILYTILGKKNSKDYNAVIADDNFRNKEKVSLPKSDLESTVKFPKSLKYPDKDFPAKFYKDRFSYKGVSRVSDMFSKRNLLALALLHTSINELPLKNKNLFMLAFTNTLLHVSKLKAENVRPLSVNNFWIPDDFIEENVWWRFVDRVKNVKMAKEVIAEKVSQNEISKPISKIYNKSSLKMSEIKMASVDYLITDPPYGDTIQYSELSYVWNCWLEKEFDIENEVIINPVQKKGMNEYYNQIVSFIGEVKRVLKKDAYFTLAFHNKDLKIWISLAELIRDHGMELVDISSYNTFGSPYNKNWAKFSPKSDFYVTFRNSQKEIKKYNQKRVYPHEIANEITKCLGKKNGKLFNLNKAYDLFVGVVISKIFDGSQVAEHERLSIENITNLFQEITQHQNKEIAQQRLLKLEHI
ncbi:MAG: DNA methyltransferase [Patescibacteria group bacterium]